MHWGGDVEPPCRQPPQNSPWGSQFSLLPLPHFSPITVLRAGSQAFPLPGMFALPISAQQASAAFSQRVLLRQTATSCLTFFLSSLIFILSTYNHLVYLLIWFIVHLLL